MKLIIGLILCIPITVWGGFRLVRYIQFDRNCQSYLKRAADANTPEMAQRELDQALSYMDANHLTGSYTSVIYTTPDEDIGFWYRNVKQSRQELANLKPDASPLERSNMLMKLRETLLDNGEDGQSVTVPEGISIYPNNTGWFIFAIAAFLTAIIGAIFIFIWIDEL